MRSEKESSKVRNKFPNPIKGISQNKEQRFSFANPRFIERYIDGKLYILVHFRVGKINQEIIACFEKFCSDPVVVGQPCGRTSREDRLGLCQMLSRIEAREIVPDRYQQSVLVNLVEGMEQPQCVIPSLVWFDFPDRVYNILFHALYLSSEGLVLRGFGDFIEDREGSLRVGNFSVCHYEGASQIVEAAPKILERISAEQREFGWDIACLGEVIDWLSRLWITLYPETVRLGVTEGGEGQLEILDVLLGPLDL